MPRTTSILQGHAAISLADEDAVRRVLIDSVVGLWGVVNELARLRPSRPDRYRVTIFGSARARPGAFAYEETKRVAAALAAMGCDILTGGGPGLMQAANEGAASAGERRQSVGIPADLPFEQASNALAGEVFEQRTCFSRLHQFVLASDAFLVAPGGIGTLLEMVMVWQLLQVTHLAGAPLILVGKMWPGLIEWVREAMLENDPPLAAAADLTIPRCVMNADEAVFLLREHHATWRKGAAEGLAPRVDRAQSGRWRGTTAR